MFSVENEICKSSVDGSSVNMMGVSAMDFATDGAGSVGCRFVTRNCSCGAVSDVCARFRLDLNMDSGENTFDLRLSMPDVEGSASRSPFALFSDDGPAKMNSLLSSAATRLDIIGSFASERCMTSSI